MTLARERMRAVDGFDGRRRAACAARATSRRASRDTSTRRARDPASSAGDERASISRRCGSRARYRRSRAAALRSASATTAEVLPTDAGARRRRARLRRLDEPGRGGCMLAARAPARRAAARRSVAGAAPAVFGSSRRSDSASPYFSLLNENAAARAPPGRDVQRRRFPRRAAAAQSRAARRAARRARVRAAARPGDARRGARGARWPTVPSEDVEREVEALVRGSSRPRCSAWRWPISPAACR